MHVLVTGHQVCVDLGWTLPCPPCPIPELLPLSLHCWTPWSPGTLLCTVTIDHRTPINMAIKIPCHQEPASIAPWWDWGWLVFGIHDHGILTHCHIMTSSLVNINILFSRRWFKPNQSSISLYLTLIYYHWVLWVCLCVCPITFIRLSLFYWLIVVVSWLSLVKRCCMLTCHWLKVVLCWLCIGRKWL